MRGKFVLVVGVVLVLGVVGGVGGLTMRAFGGVARTTVTTNTVTRFCVYVDRTNGGESRGDVSVLPKYGNKTCVVGKRGPAGNTSVITWNKTVAQAFAGGAKRNAGLGGLPPGTVDLAKVGPFTVRGVCFVGDGTESVTDVVSAQDGSSLAWNNNNYDGTFSNGSVLHVSNISFGAPGQPDFSNEGPNGEFSVSTADNKTAFTAFANNGVYMNGPTGPACSFTGYLVVEK